MNVSRPCLCSLESMEDYVVINNTDTPQDHPVSAVANFFSGARQALLRVSHFNFALRQGTCCQGWVNYPSEDDRSLDAHSVFLSLKDCIQRNRQTLLPPVQELQLTAYKFVSGDGAYSSYYFLRIHAGENFDLFVKAGLTSEVHSHVKLLRLSSHEERVCCS